MIIPLSGNLILVHKAFKAVSDGTQITVKKGTYKIKDVKLSACKKAIQFNLVELPGVWLHADHDESFFRDYKTPSTEEIMEWVDT